ncbi:MAG: glycosyltransferase family 9 protein [Ignavibacteria bacterium]
MNSEVERILIIQTAYLGDAVLTLPLIQKLKEINPNGIIDVLAISATEELFLSSPLVNDVIIIEKLNKHRGLLALCKFIKDLRRHNYNKIYCPHRSFRSALITLGLRVNESYGFDKNALKFAFRYITEYEKHHHEVRRNLALIREDLAIQDWKILPKVYANDQQKRKVNELLSANELINSFISIAPGSIWNTKRYPKEYFMETIQLLVDRDENVVLIGGVDDKSLCEEINSQVNGIVINFAGELTVPETVYLLEKSKLLITNDSAPTHLGMCADIPVLTLYCSTVPNFGFYPYNDKSSVLSFEDLECKPCGIHGHKKCPIKTFDCGYKLLPEDVIKEADRLMKINE